MPELDVLRGVAVLMVFLYHALYWSNAVASSRIGNLIIKASVIGWLGVNLFFVLSGFLISGILLDTKGHPSYSRRFYLRRVVRILPAYFVTIVVLLAFHSLTFGSTIVALLFLANYQIFPVVGGYGPFWSLSVEEQFYLIWPMLVARVSVRSLTLISLGLCLIEPVLRWLSASGRVPLGDIHNSTYLIADNLAMGALAAIFARSRYGSIQNGVRLGLAMILAGLAILLAGIPLGILHRTNVFGSSLQTVPWNILFTGTLLLLLAIQSPLFSGIWTAPLRFLGYISYGLYLYHVIIFFSVYDKLVEHLSNPALRVTLHQGYLRLFIAGTLAIVVSWISRRFFEGYFLRFKSGSHTENTLDARRA
jgi:peptidoglycan/LPS O-acetylase OafA/YrhL